MKKAIRYILLTVCVCVFCYSAYNLINIYLNYKKIDDDYGEIAFGTMFHGFNYPDETGEDKLETRVYGRKQLRQDRFKSSS